MSAVAYNAWLFTEMELNIEHFLNFYLVLEYCLGFGSAHEHYWFAYDFDNPESMFAEHFFEVFRRKSPTMEPPFFGEESLFPVHFEIGRSRRLAG